MTLVVFEDSRLSSRGPLSGPALHKPAPTPVHLLGRVWNAAHTAWERRQTERMLEGLPADIRKDIGWPAGTDNRPVPRRPVAGASARGRA